VVDDHTRENLALVADTSLPGLPVRFNNLSFAKDLQLSLVDVTFS